jgi:hypothetical protein
LGGDKCLLRKRAKTLLYREKISSLMAVIALSNDPARRSLAVSVDEIAAILLEYAGAWNESVSDSDEGNWLRL